MKKILILLIAIYTTGTTFAQSNHKCNDNKVTDCSGSVKDVTLKVGGSYTPSGIDVGESKCDHKGCGGNVKKHKITYSSKRIDSPMRSSSFSFMSRSGSSGGINIDTSKPGTYEVTATCSEGCTGLGSGTVTVKECQICKKFKKAIDSLKQKLEKHNDRLDTLSDSLEGTEKEIVAVKADIKQAQQDIKETKKDLKNLKRLKAQTEKNGYEATKLRTRIANLEAQLAANIANGDDWNPVLKSRIAFLKGLAATLETAVDAVSTIAGAIAEAAETILEYTKILDAAKTLLATFQSELSQIKDDIEAVKDQSKLTQAQLKAKVLEFENHKKATGHK